MFVVGPNFGHYHIEKHPRAEHSCIESRYGGHLNLPKFVVDQDGTTEFDTTVGIAMAEDGSVICVGTTYGSWDGPNQGGGDIAAFRLDGNGEEIWRYQVGYFRKERGGRLRVW